MNKTIYIWFLAMLLGTGLYSQSTISIWVNGTCGMCKDRIETAAMEVGGVNKATWSEATKMLDVEVDESFIEDFLHIRLAAVGHDTKQVLATDEVYNALHSCCTYRPEEIEVAEVNEEPIDYSLIEGHQELWVDGICEMCQDRIEAKALEQTGVLTATWDIDSKTLHLGTDDQFRMRRMHRAMVTIGHDTKERKASPLAYESLHACCKYRDIDVIASHSPEEESLVPDFNDGHDIHGIILENTKEGKLEAVVGATVFWSGTTNGSSSDSDGYFHLDNDPSTNDLIVSYVGYSNDTINMEGQSAVEIKLKNNFILDEVNIVFRKKSTQISFVNTMKVQQIDQKELLKAACCSLSESFETTPSVDVSFTDAVTGTRKIELLGLAGPYVQVMREGLPFTRGLAAIYGFDYTPGPWIESMQLNMGAGSITNGPEAMTGQINVEIKKPNESERLFINGYANAFQRFEMNINGSEKVSDKWSTAYLAHASNQSREADIQNDGFLDAPVSQQYSLMNRWRFRSGKGLNAQFGIKGTYANRLSGQFTKSEQQNEDLWQADITTERLEGWFKMGKVLANPQNSFGFQLNMSTHDQAAAFGPRTFNGTQNSIYANAIYQGVLGSEKHRIRAGMSTFYDGLDEFAVNTNFVRDEWLTGIYGEYHWGPNDQWDIIAGLRSDYNSIYGFYTTPRLHVKYAPQDNLAIRLVAGKGQRTATVFAENVGMFASNRTIRIQGEENSNKAYGLDQEIAWNAGLNVTKEFIIQARSLVVSADYYYTFFETQVIYDFDLSTQDVFIYNLNGSSYSHSIQAQADYEILKGLDLRLAYRFNDVQMDFQSGRLEKPLIARHRGFLNIGYEFLEGWNADATFNLQGSKRLPFTGNNPEIYQLAERSPVFYTLNAQISKTWKSGVNVYVGGENLLNFVQPDPILAANDPYGQYFDSSMVWGPIMGRNIYVGFRYSIY